VATSTILVRIRKTVRGIDPVPVLFTLVLVVLFAPVLAGTQSVFWGLPLLQFFPWHEIAKQDILAGYLPIWNPQLGMGAPLLANAQSALLYPPNWILLILPVQSGQGLLLVAHLLLAGIGVAKLSGNLGIGRFGQAVAGLAFMLSGYLAARAWFLTINASVAWLPWIILAGERALMRERRWISLPLAILLCLQWLAGHWQTAWYTGLILAGWMAARALALRPVWKNLLRAIVLVLGAVGFAFALGAAQFLPTVGYWLHSQRAAGAGAEAALAYSFWPWHLLTFLAPNFFGNPAHGDYWGYANYWEDAVYIGLLPLGLAAAAAWAAFRRKGVAGFPYGYLLAILPVTLLLALGTNTPVFTFLFERVPTFNLFQAPARMMIAFVFALSLLAAAGADRWLAALEVSWTRAANIGVVAAAAGVAGAAATRLAFVKPSFSESIILAGVIGLLIAALFYLQYLSGSRPVLAGWLPAAAVALVALDLIIADTGLVPAASPDLFTAANPAAPEVAAGLAGRRIYMPEEIRYRLMYDRAFVFRTFSGLSDWMDVRRWELPNVNVLDGIASANNFDSFVPARYAALLASVDALSGAQRDRLLQMMDVGAVWEWPAGAEQPSLRFLPAGAARAWGVCRAQWAIRPEDALAAVTDPQFDPARTAILELGSGEEGAACSTPPQVSVVVSQDPNGVRLETIFPQDGYLVLADVNDHGWEAFLDGERVPTLQADYAFRAVRVPAGRHTVAFRYAPLAFWVGALVSGACVLLLLAIGLWFAVRKIRRRRAIKITVAAGAPV
jgi:hypothetical protein